MSKLGAICTPGQVQRGPAYCLGGIRHKGGASLILALVWNVGTGRPDDKGEARSGSPMRARVPMRGTGAEQPVVAMRSCNREGAKGLYCSALLMDQPVMGGASWQGKVTCGIAASGWAIGAG